MIIRDWVRLSSPPNELESLRTEHRWSSRLPSDTQWYRGSLGIEFVPRLFHIHAPLWAALSGGTGRVLDSAERISKGAGLPQEYQDERSAIRSLADRVADTRIGTLVLGTNDLEGNAMLLDGNHRAVAVVLARERLKLARNQRIPCCVAHSASVPLLRWDPDS